MSNNDNETTIKISDLNFYDILFKSRRHTIRNAVDQKGNKLAVKQTPKNTLRDEYNMMNKINCPYIMKAKGFAEEDGMNYLIMDRADKDLLISLCQDGPKTEDITRNIMFSIITAVNYLHENNIWHRDVKLENVFIFSDGLNERYVLGDFEFAKEIQLQWMNTEHIGTEGYLAPELLMRQRYNNKVDCWALGTMMYFLLTKDLPFDSLLDQVSGNIKKDDPHISECAFDLISNLLKVKINDRFTTQQALEHPFFNPLRQQVTYVSDLTSDIVKEMHNADSIAPNDIAQPK